METVSPLDFLVHVMNFRRPGFRSLSLAAFALFLLHIGNPLAAQTSTSVTVPEGYLTVTIPAGSVSSPSVTTFSVPVYSAVLSSFVGEPVGQISAVTSNTISNAAGGWSAGALSQAATPYFIRITSGAAAGQTFQISTTTANTASVLTVLNQQIDLTTLGIVSGNTYQIFPAETLATLFGTSTLSSTSSSTADVVEIFSGGVWSDYFYNSSSSIWQKGSMPVDQSNVVLRPDAGITFYRRGSTPLQYILMGTVPSTNIQLVVNTSGLSYVGNVFPVDQSLSVAAYNSLPGWVNNTGNLSAASTITFLNGATYAPYNYLLSANQWRKGSLPVNQNSVVIPAGTPVQIQQPNTTVGVTIFSRTLPYSVN